MFYTWNRMPLLPHSFTHTHTHTQTKTDKHVYVCARAMRWWCGCIHFILQMLSGTMMMVINLCGCVRVYYIPRSLHKNEWLNALYVDDAARRNKDLYKKWIGDVDRLRTIINTAITSILDCTISSESAQLRDKVKAIQITAMEMEIHKALGKFNLYMHHTQTHIDNTQTITYTYNIAIIMISTFNCRVKAHTI